MPRLASEGIVGADAIFACLGPALEIFSRYSRVEKASGDPVSLKDYLEHVWAAVSKEALTMIFAGADATGFDPDARVTAMWFWTLSTGTTGTTDSEGDGEADTEEDEEDTKPAKVSGYVLEYDAARKIAQGLGAHLEQLTGIVQVKGDKARLLPVSERAKALFGKEEAKTPTGKAKKPRQKTLFDEAAQDGSEDTGWGELNAPQAGATVLDRLHQTMILFAAGRGEALGDSWSRTGWAGTRGSGSWGRRCRPSIPPAPRRNVGSMACWQGRRGWDSDMMRELDQP